MAIPLGRRVLRRRSSALENFGVAAVPDDRLVSNDDGRARLQGVVNLCPQTPD